MRPTKSKFDKVINILSIVCLAGTTFFLFAKWGKIPQEIPGHYNAAGEIDSMTGKGSLFVLLLVGWVLYIGISVIEQFPRIWNTGVEVTEENKERVYRILKDLLGTVKLEMAGVFSFLTIYSVNGKNLPGFFLPVFLVVVFGSLIYHIIRLVKAK